MLVESPASCGDSSEDQEYLRKNLRQQTPKVRRPRPNAPHCRFRLLDDQAPGFARRAARVLYPLRAGLWPTQLPVRHRDSSVSLLLAPVASQRVNRLGALLLAAKPFGELRKRNVGHRGDGYRDLRRGG
jgi:hypothetical protein